MTIRTLYLIRHGQYDSSVQSTDGGGLTQVGKEQAKYVGQVLRDIPVDIIVASTMIRAIETANIVAHYVEAEFRVTDLLREAIPSIPPRIAPHILKLMNLNPNITHDSIHEDQLRADEAFEKIFTPPPKGETPHEFLVCHGNIMRYLTCKALGINSDTWGKININHCGITTITVDHEGLMRLVSHNETYHLPRELLTD